MRLPLAAFRSTHGSPGTQRRIATLFQPNSKEFVARKAMTLRYRLSAFEGNTVAEKLTATKSPVSPNRATKRLREFLLRTYNQ